MITREYVTLFLVGSCFLLDYSIQVPLQTQFQSRSKAEGMSAQGQTGGMTAKASLEQVTSLEGRTRLRRHRLKIQRVKRGWVWNQFFVLEEYMGSDPQYVGKVRKYCYHQTLKLKLVKKMKNKKEENKLQNLKWYNSTKSPMSKVKRKVRLICTLNDLAFIVKNN